MIGAQMIHRFLLLMAKSQPPGITLRTYHWWFIVFKMVYFKFVIKFCSDSM